MDNKESDKLASRRKFFGNAFCPQVITGIHKVVQQNV